MPLIPAADAKQYADAVGGRIADLVQRQACGAGQPCPWDLALATGLTAQNRAAAAWIIADEVMSWRADDDVHAYTLWREATLAGEKLVGNDREHVFAYAYAVFGTDAAAGRTKGADHGLPGYVGEWLWYMTTRDLPPEPGRTVEYLSRPGMEVRDSGGDGLIVHRVDGSTLGFIFRLWEMKKYTGAGTLTGTIRGAWQQLNARSSRYLAQTSWTGDPSPDAAAFMRGMTRLWIDAHTASNGGVSVATNPTAIPKKKAFDRAHKHFTTHTHPGALQGLVVAVDNLDELAQDVRGYVWSAL